MVDTVVTVQNIVKNYGNFRAVDDLSFEIRSGEIFAMLGPNGSGKTTTIRMILDILRPDSGSVAVFGGPLSDEKKDRIGYLPEERGLYRNVPVIEVMTYLGGLKGMSNAAARKQGMALLERLELDEHAKKKVSELSKGMQQKVQFAVTVMHAPDLIIVDEPFSGLDPVNTLVIKRLIMEFRERGGAIVMSTHQMHQVEEMADRLLMIHRGRQQLYGPVEAIRSQHAAHAIIVEGQGDWSALPGVAWVEPSGNGSGRDAVVLHLEETTMPDSVLEAIARSPNMSVRRFELAVPSLNEIFIEVVEGAAQ